MAIDYLGGIGVLPDPMGAINKQLAFKVGLDAQQADAMFKAAQISAAANKLQRQAQFTTAMQGYLAHPTAEGLAGLIGSFPEYSEDAKAAFGALDGAKQKRDLTQLGEVASLASSGNWSKAAEAMQARVEADRAAGDNDPTDQYILQGLQSGDEAKQKEALGLLSYGLGVAAGPEHAASFLETYGLSKKPDVRSVEMGGSLVSVDPLSGKGTVVYESPYVKDASGAILERTGTGTAPGAPDNSPAVQSVASTLSASLPPNVVAGFLGNFHLEGGYGGAQGDGGSANGIAQWRQDRAANFERVIGKPIAQATPEEQAQFVLHEMQHPEEAGMTVAQRDKILNAKSPGQAAALIDQFYERSDGKARAQRMSAATAFAGGGTNTDVAGSSDGAPPGFRVVVPGKPDTTDRFHVLTPEEAQARDLDPNIKWQLNERTNQITALGGQQRQAKQIPQSVVNKAQPSIDVRDTMARLAGTWQNDFGGHAVLGDNLNTLQRTLGKYSGAPEGMANWWADYQSMDNIVRNQLFGSALTEHEKQAYAATTITPRMDPSEIRERFNRRRAIINGAVERQQNFLKKNGYDPEAVDALFQPLGNFGAAPSASPPVRVNSVQQAQKLAPGTLYLAPDGKVRRR